MSPPTVALSETGHASEAVVRAYHERTKHHLQRYAAGPETLDWDAQPDPFRRYAGAPLLALPLPADTFDGPAWDALARADAVAPQPFGLRAIGLLFELSFALSAWKQHGPDRWAVRCTPSSGNLHPTEAYLIARGIDGLADGLHHYAPREHALECRARLVAGAERADIDAAAAAPASAAHEPGPARLWLGLGSIHWREAWKYGERAFRYCQLDVGHALGAVRYAAATLGWQARVVEGLGADELAALLGLDREADFPGRAEREEPELLIELLRAPAPATCPPAWPADTLWQGTANRLDRHPMYRWPIIDEVARASRDAPRASETPMTAIDPAIGRGSDAPPPMPAPASRMGLPSSLAPAVQPALPAGPAGARAADLIRRRRSAQRFDARATMPRAAFDRLVRALQPRGLPWDVAPPDPRVHLLLFAHRVEGLPAGAYALPRSAAGEALLRATLEPSLAWTPVECDGGPPLFRLAENPGLAGTLRTLNCHQALGSDAMLAVSMLAEFDAPLPYRARLREAGLAGQVLYLEAEALGLRGTGIGCYFDDALHALVGLQAPRLQAVYHFTVGRALDDPRIQSEPPYAGRAHRSLDHG